MTDPVSSSPLSPPHRPLGLVFVTGVTYLNGPMEPVPEVSAEVQAVMKEALPVSYDPLERADVTPSELMNKFFPDESALGELDTFLHRVRNLVQETDREILQAVRQQTRSVRQAKKDLEESKCCVQDLLAKLNTIKAKANDAEQFVETQVGDILQMDRAKRYLIRTMTAMNNLQLLMGAVNELEQLVGAQKYKEVASVMGAVNQLLSTFRPYRDSVPLLADLFVVHEKLKEDSKRNVFRDIKAYVGEGIVPSGRSLLDACHVVESLGMGVRLELVDWFCMRGVEAFQRLFPIHDPTVGLQDYRQRCAWVNRKLREYDERFDIVFPRAWKVDQEIATQLCMAIREGLEETLERTSVDTDAILEVLQESVDLEASLVQRFTPILMDMATFFGDGEEKEHKERERGGSFVQRTSSVCEEKEEKEKEIEALRFRRIISCCLDPYIKEFVQFEEKNMKKVIGDMVGETARVLTDQGIEIFRTANQLFSYTDRAIERVSALTMTDTVSEVFKMFQNVLKFYCDFTRSQLPSVGSKVSKEGISSNKELICLLANTAEHCCRKTSTVETQLKRLASMDRVEEFTLAVQRADFMAVVDDACSELAQHIFVEMEPAFAAIATHNWNERTEMVDQSQFVGAIADVLNETVPRASLLLAPVCYRQFCNSLVASFAQRYMQQIYRCRRISEMGAQQLLMDTVSLKTLLMRMSKMSERGFMKEGQASFARTTNHEMGKVEVLLRVILTPHDSLLENFRALMKNGTIEDLVKIMNLKGLQAHQKSNLKMKFLKMSGSADSSTDPEETSGIRAPLSPDQLRLAAYETLLLCTGQGEKLSDKEKVILSLARVQMNITKREHMVVASNLNALGVEDSLRTSSHYRFLLLKQQRPGHFERLEDFSAWQSRQIAVFLRSFWTTFQNARISTIQLMDTQMTIFDVGNTISRLFAEVKELGEDTDRGSDFPEQVYKEALSRVEKYLLVLYGELDKLQKKRRENGGPIPLAMRWPYPHPFTMELYGELLKTLFDSIEEGKFVADERELLGLFGNVRSRLGISDYMHDLCFVAIIFQRWEITPDSDLLARLKALLRKLHKAKPEEGDDGPGVFFANTDAGEVGTRMDPPYTEVALGPVLKALQERLSDYRSNFGANPADIPDALQLLANVKVVLVPKEALYTGMIEADIGNAICLAMKRHYQRLSSKHERPLSMEGVGELALILLGEIEAEENYFASSFASFHPTPLEVALSEWARLFGLDVQEAFNHVDSFTLDLLTCTGELKRLYGSLERIVPIAKLQMLDLQHLLNPIVGKWASHLGQMFEDYLFRCLKNETWKPILQEGIRHSASVVDLFTFLRQTISFPFNNDLPLSLDVVRKLGISINTVMKTYAEELQRGCDRWDMLVPPLPEQHGRKGKLGSLISPFKAAAAFKSMLLDKDDRENRDQPESDEEDEKDRVELLPMEDLCVRLNNIVFALEKTHEVETNLIEKWAATVSSAVAEKKRATRTDLDILGLSHLLQPSMEAFHRAEDTVILYFGARIGYHDLHGVILEDLYVPSASDSRVNTVISALDNVLEILYDKLTPEQFPRVLKGIFGAVLQVFERVLFDGGEKRLFTASDHAIFLQDLTSLVNFFVARDESGVAQGVDEADAHMMTKQLTSRIVRALGEETSALVKAYEGAPEEPGDNVVSKHDIIRVLQHRREAGAKKFLKLLKAR